MPNYDIVDYYYNKFIQPDDLKSIDKVKERIRNNDPKGTARGWLNNGGEDTRYSGGYNKSFREFVQEENQSYIAETKSRIDRGEQVTIDEEYEESTQTELQEYMEQQKKEEEPEEVTVTIAGESFTLPSEFSRGRPTDEVYAEVTGAAEMVMAQIQSSTTRDEIAAIDIPSNLPRSIRSMLAAEKKNAINELPTEE